MSISALIAATDPVGVRTHPYQHIAVLRQRPGADPDTAAGWSLDVVHPKACATRPPEHPCGYDEVRAVEPSEWAGVIGVPVYVWRWLGRLRPLSLVEPCRLRGGPR